MKPRTYPHRKRGHLCRCGVIPLTDKSLVDLLLGGSRCLANENKRIQLELEREIGCNSELRARNSELHKRIHDMSYYIHKHLQFAEDQSSLHRDNPFWHGFLRALTVLAEELGIK